METTFDNIEYIIKKLVEYQVKNWVSDVHYDRTTKLLPLHPLSVAKHIAYDCGWSKRDFGGRDKEISAHMRPYNHIKELSSSVAREIISCLDDDTYYYAGSPRYVLGENGEKVRKSVSQYFDAGYGDDSIILFLLENDPYAFDKFDKCAGLDIKANKPKETDEERNARHNKEEREEDDERIRCGKVIAAVEMSASCWGHEYHYCDGTSEPFNWKDFRSSIAEHLNNGCSECGAFKSTIDDKHTKWQFECCEDVIELYKRYALKNLDDKRFMKNLVKDLPEFALFKNADDFEKYEDNMDKIHELEKTLKWPVRIKL